MLYEKPKPNQEDFLNAMYCDDNLAYCCPVCPQQHSDIDVCILLFSLSPSPSLLSLLSPFLPLP